MLHVAARDRARLFLLAAGLLCAALLAGPRVIGQTKDAGSASRHGSALQEAVDLAMAGQSGTAVVLDVSSNRLLASYRLEVAARRRAAPGSTVKPFTLQALLEWQIVQRDTRFVCPLELRLAGHRMDCSHPRLVEPLDAVSALAYSCNNYFAHHAPRLKAEEIDAALARAGLTSVSGLVANEAAGRTLPAATREQLSLKAIGAGYVQVTPLALLNAYRRLAAARREGVRKESLETVFAGLEASVAYGTAHAAQVDGLRVAGKTGTAAAAEGNWTHAWFAGYAPADKPEIALVVFLERGTGGADAAPIAKRTLEAYTGTRRAQ